MTNSTSLVPAPHSVSRRGFLQTTGGAAGAVALAGGTALATAPDVASEARRLLAEHREIQSRIDRHGDLIDRMCDAKAPLAEHRVAEATLGDLVGELHDVEERIAAMACKALGRPPLRENELIVVVVDGWAFPIKDYGGGPCCGEEIVYPANVLVIGGGR